MNHSFNIEVATQSGILSAILLENIAHWIKKNKADEKHFYEGRYWTYSSRKSFSEQFPYASEEQTRRALEKLEEHDWIKTGCFNPRPMDRTLWYALSEKGEKLYFSPKIPIWQNRQMHLANSPISFGEIATAIPDIIIYNNNTPQSPQGEVLRDSCFSFAEFWKLYGLKIDRAKCEAKYKKIAEADRTKIREVLPQYVKSTFTNGSYPSRKNPLTWLNGRNWEDEALTGTATTTRRECAL